MLAKEEAICLCLQTKSPFELLLVVAKNAKVHHHLTLIDENGPSHSKLFAYRLQLEILQEDNDKNDGNLPEIYVAKSATIKKARQEVCHIGLRQSFLLSSSLCAYAKKFSRKLKRRAKQETRDIIKDEFSKDLYCRKVFMQRLTDLISNESVAIVPSNCPQPNCPNSLDECLKSKVDINIVLEIGEKLQLSVAFQVIKSEGPSHERIFFVECRLGHKWSVTGEGGSTKHAKHVAAQRLIEYLRHHGENDDYIHNLLHEVSKVNSSHRNKKKGDLQREVKQQKSSPSYGQHIQPVCRLVQICQAENLTEPLYSAKSIQLHQFFVRCSVESLPSNRIPAVPCEITVNEETDLQTWTTDGVAPNKKLAKRLAAEMMLECLGYSLLSVPQQAPSKSLLKMSLNTDVTVVRATPIFKEMVRKTSNDNMTIKSDFIQSSSSLTFGFEEMNHFIGAPGKSVCIQEENKIIYEVSRHLVKGDRRFRKAPNSHKRRHSAPPYGSSVSKSLSHQKTSSSGRRRRLSLNPRKIEQSDNTFQSYSKGSIRFGCWKGEAAALAEALNPLYSVETE